MTLVRNARKDSAYAYPWIKVLRIEIEVPRVRLLQHVRAIDDIASIRHVVVILMNPESTS